ncbi:iron-containing alcohol dehydrogenase [cf. Phormidesmis sp. LEGE 11477]|uniref:iron-containing alcohol dehydrogenase n=1 Tax=cf. Phormidesmis sp. LEGE 11477 TaxID=1828680 RepID=UPI0018826877|nr:iron-containing alcohol dehydrogenase [cf. Phormidesmis sp. LEGE 11477]MBE9064226.1 iron-containing alcohol dehydrogenase [cf. Phormidesmis sp. LEGE 11477]
MSSNLTTYHFPTKIRFGAGARHELSDTLRALGIQRPLIVTDQDIAQLSWFTQIEESLLSFGAGTFSSVRGNPVVSQVSAGLAAYPAHDADGIVAVGGGAPMDVAKAIALMAHHPGHLFDYEDGASTRPIDRPIPPIIAIPTTAGTGSEVGRSAVISDDETHAKKIVFDPQLLPKVVLADPELLLGLPAKITAATGMDALTHLIEAFLAKGENPLCDGIALEGLYLVSQHLKDSVLFAQKLATGESVDPAAHLQARAGMLNASMMGAIAFQKGLGVTHSCAHALSTLCDTHHGLANGVMLPAAMRFNLDAAPEKFLRMARVVNPAANSGEALIDWIVALSQAIGMPASLQTLGVSNDRVDQLVDIAIADACHPFNPKPVTAADFHAIYQDALAA